MNPRRLPIGVLMIVPIVLGFGLYAFTGQAEEVEDPNAPSTATGTASPPGDSTPTGTRTTVEEAYGDYELTQTAGQPTPTPPIAAHGVFHDGAQVRVSAGAGDCLNARNSPSIEGDYVIVNICIPDGYEGVTSGTTQESEGHWWWNMAGLGWVAEEYLAYLGEFDPRANIVPELSGAAGKVAFLRGNDVWMMSPDGSGQQLLEDNLDTDGNNYLPGPVDLTWSPDGTRLSYNVPRYDVVSTPEEPGSVDLHVLTIDGAGPAVSRVFEAVAGGGWSTDGIHLGVVREPSPDQMGSGIRGVPAILDVTTGGQLVLGSERFWQQKPPAFNHDGSLLMVNELVSEQDSYRSAIVIYTADGVEQDRIDFTGETTGYASPAWSPTSDRIAMHVSRQQGDQYTAQYQVYDVAARTFAGGAEPPKVSERIGGRCGGGDMWNTEWSADGSRVLYSFTWGDTGANGIWSWDLRDGEQNILYAANAGAPTAGPDGLVMFSSNDYPASHIFHGTSDGGFSRIITDGSSPVWYVPR